MLDPDDECQITAFFNGLMYMVILFGLALGAISFIMFIVPLILVAIHGA